MSVNSRLTVLAVTNKIKPVPHCYKMHDIKCHSNEVTLSDTKQEAFLKTHVSHVAAKANSIRYFLQHNLSTCSRDVKLKKL